MKEVNKDEILIIKAGGKGFPYNGIVKDGYNMEFPYYEVGLFLRILREICFRLPFLPKRIWYNKEILHYSIHHIIIWDPLITEDFLFWLHDKLPTTQINFCYDNLVGKARHIMPNQIPVFCRKWSYDKKDCEKYNLHLSPSTYITSYLKPKQKTEYDVLFVGRDKGRAAFLLEFERKLNEIGLRTYFIITKDGRLSRKKSYHKDSIPYERIVELITQSRAILNVALPGQVGTTIRDLESMFFSVKLLTTNASIVSADFYQHNNIFVVDENFDPMQIKDFVYGPLVEIDAEVKRKHEFSYFIQMITNNE
jgi:hypothetical protein